MPFLIGNMKNFIFIIICFLLFSCGETITQKEYKSPDKQYGELFDAVQKQQLFGDDKVFADAIPIGSVEEIIKKYQKEKKQSGFDLKQFVLKNFKIPNYEISKSTLSFDDFINQTLLTLVREPKDDSGSLIPTRKKYISGGHKFEELNYFNSYFDFLALKSLGKDSLANEIVVNCAQYIQDFGHVPAGNRSYMLSGSNFPVFAMMVNDLKNPEMAAAYASALTKEYQFWMSSESKEESEAQVEAQKTNKDVFNKVVFLPENNLLNRYFDSTNTARPDFYLKDIKSKNNVEIRTEAESGWENSSRWVVNGNLAATSFLHLDLNASLYFMEKMLADIYKKKNKPEYAASFENLANKRKAIFDKYFWNEQAGYYFDYNFKVKKQSEIASLAAIWPLYFGLASQKQADLVLNKIEKDFLKNGGLINEVSQNATDGSAQMQWICFETFKKYGRNELANQIKDKWLKTNQQYYAAKGRLVEKLNVITPEKNILEDKMERIDAPISVLVLMKRQ
jgi:alpha,alpha-trehalase